MQPTNSANTVNYCLEHNLIYSSDPNNAQMSLHVEGSWFWKMKTLRLEDVITGDTLLEINLGVCKFWGDFFGFIFWIYYFFPGDFYMCIFSRLEFIKHLMGERFKSV